MKELTRSDAERQAHKERLRQQMIAQFPHRRAELGRDGQADALPAAEEPSAMPPGQTTVTKFDTKWLLSPTLIALVDEVVQLTDWPVEFLAAPLLAICASAIGTSRQVCINELWRELPCLWVAAIGDPGSGKTPSLKFI